MGLSPVMVGRSAELDRLAGLVGTRRKPKVALVAGEAGIGKTRLVQELVRRVPPGTVVLAGQADPGTLGRPMELVLDAVDAAAGARPAGGGPGGGAPDRDGSGGGSAGVGTTGSSSAGRGGVAELLAVVRDADRPADERVRAGVDLVRHVGQGRTTLVVFEDLHWADAESVAVFERLAEPAPAGEPAPDGLLLVGTYRPDGFTRRHAAAEALPRLERRHSVAHVHLERLNPAEVSGFLAAVYDIEPSFRVVDALHTRTGGNPFFLEELVASSGEMPGAHPEAPLPWTVAELVRSELDDLAPEVRAMVNAAAVLGRRFSFDVLAAVTGTQEDELIDRLRTAIDQGLLVEVDPDVFGFHHELAREAVESALLGRERRRLHEAALAALREAGSRDHVALADHARGAGRFDDMVDEARAGARDSLALGSSYQALQLAETGLAEVPDDEELLSLAARAAWLAGLPDDALHHSERWLAVARAAGDVDHEAAALAMRVRAAFEQGDVGAMVAHTAALEAVIDRLTTDEARGRAMAAVAQSYMLRDQVDAARTWADEALALAEAHGLDHVRLAAMVEKGSTLLMDPGQVDEARDLLTAAADEAERVGEHLLAARSLNNLVWHARQWSDVDDVRRLIDRARAEATAAGFDSMAINDVAASLAQLAAVEGDLDGAIARLDEVGGGDGRAGWTKASWLAVFRAGLALEAGDLDGAATFIEQTKPATARTAVSVLGLDFHLACRRGDLAAARRLLGELLVAADAEGYASPSQVHDLLAAALGAGMDPAELRPLVDRVGHWAGHRLEPDNAWRRMLEAQLAEAAGDVEAAIAGFEAASCTLGAAPEILAGHRGTAHVGAAANLVRAGRLDAARPHVDEAARHLARWGGWRVDQLRAVERRLGIGDDPEGPAALTPREREVAMLLAGGLTNAQLAERLYISPRTAAVHVSNLLAKLGMTSRTEVAAWAVRTGLAPDA
jgi:DNA-binding CsgD family transcriptional regulator/tetratricopeptide (TPR) repeat protein